MDETQSEDQCLKDSSDNRYRVMPDCDHKRTDAPAPVWKQAESDDSHSW